MFKNLIFYEYLFKKMLKSVSTYITGIISLIPIWAVTWTGISKGSIDENTFAMLSYFTFPIMIIFMSFKASQVFRDEIENKTILTIQAKPITRKQMVYQGLLSINTFSLFLAMAGGFIPFAIGAIYNGWGMVGHGALIALTQMLLLGIISILALWMSISMGGKAFIGTMIGGFVAGFYVLFGITAFINLYGSRTFKASELMRKEGVVAKVDQKMDNKYTITISSQTTQVEAQKIYDEFNDLNKNNAATITAWFNPAIHWTSMFQATSNSKVGNIQNGGIDIWNILTASAKIHMLNKLTPPSTNNQFYSFNIEIEDTKLIPAWYPYLIWIAFAGIAMPFVVRSITRKNIA